MPNSQAQGTRDVPRVNRYPRRRWHGLHPETERGCPPWLSAPLKLASMIQRAERAPPRAGQQGRPGSAELRGQGELSWASTGTQGSAPPAAGALCSPCSPSRPTVPRALSVRLSGKGTWPVGWEAASSTLALPRRGQSEGTPEALLKPREPSPQGAGSRAGGGPAPGRSGDLPLVRSHSHSPSRDAPPADAWPPGKPTPWPPSSGSGPRTLACS